MKPIEGRLQTAEHILAGIVEEEFGAIVIMASFHDEYGSVDFSCDSDLRSLNVFELENKVNDVINRNLDVGEGTMERSKAEEEFDLSRVPEDIDEIRIVSVGDFDSRPCKDLHVSNTREIGKFIIGEIKRVGKNKYRIIFGVEDR